MADNINYNKERGTHSFVSNQELAWHGLGKIVDGAMTSEEAIHLANLDYNVAKCKIAAIFPKGSNLKSKYINDARAIYRTDTFDIFGTASKRYEVVQNTDAFRFMDSIVGEGKAIFETAGALGKGETIFITAKLPYHIRINGNDVIENYLVVSNGHNGRTSLNIFLTPIRVVCANTLAVGLENNKFNISLRHTGSIHDKIADAREVLDISSTISDKMQETFKHLTSIKVNDNLIERYFNNVFLNADEINALAAKDVRFSKSEDISSRKKNIIHGVHDFYHNGVGQEGIVGSAFGAFSAVNGWMSNNKKFANETKRMESLVLGGQDFKTNNSALSLALTLDNDIWGT